MWRHEIGGTGVFPRVERSSNGIRGTAAALIVLASVAGCSSSSSSPSTPASSPSTFRPAAPSSNTAPATAPVSTLSPAATGPSPCATSGLNVTLGPSSGYAGGVDQTIIFTNTSGATCTLYGYPGVSLVSAPPYTQIGLAAPAQQHHAGQADHAGLRSDGQRRAAGRRRAELRDRDLQPDQGGLRAHLPAEPDRPGVLGRRVARCAPSRSRPCSSVRSRPARAAPRNA